MKRTTSNWKNAILLFTLCLITTAAHAAAAQCTDNSGCEEGQTCSDGTCQSVEAETVGPAAPEVTEEPDESDASDSQTAGTVKKERIKPLWISGLVAFGTFYLTNIIVSGAVAAEENKSKAAGYAAIPLVGQFISISQDSPDYPIGDYKGPMILGGVLQIVAAGVFTAGLIIKRTPKEKQTACAPRFWLSPTPIGTNGAGAVFTMTHF